MDRELHVIAWNQRAEDLWGLRADEVKGQNFLNLEIGLPTDQLRSGIRTALAGERDVTEISIPATNRRGKSIDVRITVTPLIEPEQKQTQGVILFMEEVAQ